MSYWWTASVVVRNTGRGEGKREKHYQIVVNRERTVLVNASRFQFRLFRVPDHERNNNP
jgi:hypothetical protein